MLFEMGASYSEHRTRADSYAAQAEANRSEHIASACAGLEPPRYSECVAEQHEAQRTDERSEQDLGAQQGMAEAAWWMVFVSALTLLITATGVWFVKRTLDATLVAVEDTGKATNAMREANEIAREVARNELRPYLFVDRLNLVDIHNETEEVEIEGETHEVPSAFFARVEVHLRNYGKVPARNIRVHRRTYLARFYLGRIGRVRRASVAVPVCAPGHERRFFAPFFVTQEDRGEFDSGSLWFVIRLRFTYDDDAGNSYTERADYNVSGDNLDTFYLLLGPHHIAEVRKRWSEIEPDLFEDEEGTTNDDEHDDVEG